MKLRRPPRQEPKPRAREVLSRDMERDEVRGELDRMIQEEIPKLEAFIYSSAGEYAQLPGKTAMAILAPEKLRPEEHALSHYSGSALDNLFKTDFAMILLQQFPNQRVEINQMFKNVLGRFEQVKANPKTAGAGSEAYAMLFLLPERQVEIRELYRQKALDYVATKTPPVNNENILCGYAMLTVVAPETRSEIQSLCRSYWKEVKQLIDTPGASKYWDLANLKIIFADEAEVTSDARLILKTKSRFSAGPQLPERNLTV
ncbi:MAG: hypothetical protein AAB558_03840 [Patescibacteria group bacterium]